MVLNHFGEHFHASDKLQRRELQENLFLLRIGRILIFENFDHFFEVLVIAFDRVDQGNGGPAKAAKSIQLSRNLPQLSEKCPSRRTAPEVIDEPFTMIKKMLQGLKAGKQRQRTDF